MTTNPETPSAPDSGEPALTAEEIMALKLAKAHKFINGSRTTANLRKLCEIDGLLFSHPHVEGEGLLTDYGLSGKGREVLRLLETSAPEDRQAELTVSDDQIRSILDHLGVGQLEALNTLNNSGKVNRQTFTNLRVIGLVDSAFPDRDKDALTPLGKRVLAAARQPQSEQATGSERPNSTTWDELTKPKSDIFVAWNGGLVKPYVRTRQVHWYSEDLAWFSNDESLPMKSTDVVQLVWLPATSQLDSEAREVVASEGDEVGLFTDKPLYNLIKNMTASGTINEKVTAIKQVRSVYPVGLATARDYVESIINDGQFPVKLEVERLRAQLAAQAAELERQRATLREVGKLVEALEFYANGDNWNLIHRDDNDSFYSNVDADSGNKATEALSTWQQAAPTLLDGGSHE